MCFEFANCLASTSAPHLKDSRLYELANEVTVKVGQKLKKDRPIYLIGMGGDTTSDIKMMTACFQYYQEVDLQQARELVLGVVGDYLAVINNSAEIRPYLHEYPFTAKNLLIQIWTYKSDGHRLPPDQIQAIDVIDGVITYYQHLPETYVRKAVCKESYEQAVQLIAASNNAETDQNPKKRKMLPRSEIFSSEDCKFITLQGEISDGRYYAPQGVFSCQAFDFGEGEYKSQDVLFDEAACVGFYDSEGNFKKAEVIFDPGLEKRRLDEAALKIVFNNFGIGILENVDDAEGIEILEEEMINGYMYFVAISIKKMSVLIASNGEHMSSTRGYLVFQDKDKYVLLSNQEVTLPEQLHNPKKHLKKLKREILEFRKTFEFGSSPAVLSEDKKETA
jgi:hypothetical protein